MNELQEAFVKHGVVYVKDALDESAISHAEHAYNWSIENPGPGAREVLFGESGSFYQDHANPASFPMYRPLLCETGLARLVADIMGTMSLWLLYEQIWLKEGRERRPTPWHQDLAYVPMAGNHIATVWLNLDPVAKDDSLEFVRASHLGPLYNPTAFDAKDPSKAMFKPGIWPPLPDMERDRNAFDIASWSVTPSDIIMFHPAVLHGGAATRDGQRRRTISLRFFGDDAYCAERPEDGVAEIDRIRRANSDDPIEQLAFALPGTPFRHASFHRLV